MDVDLVEVARQIKEFAAVHGGFSDASVPWLAGSHWMTSSRSSRC
jgi:hypothetical protein